MNTVPNDGVIRYLGMLNQERLLITSPQALSEVLVTKNYDFKKPRFVKFGLGRILGVEAILLAEGDEHRAIRKSLMPAFAVRHVKSLYPVFWDKAREVVEAMTEQILADAAKDEPPTPTPEDPEKAATEQQEASGKGKAKKEAVLEVGGWASRVTLDIIGVAGMGHDFRAVADPTNKLFRTYNLVFKPSGQARMLQLLGLFLPPWLVTRIPVRRNEDMALAVRTIRQTCVDLIREKQAKLARKELHDVDILSVALESGAFSEGNLVDQLMTFLAAGHETTASSMTWAVYMLCCHPEVQARLRREVRERLPSPRLHGAGAAAAVSSLDIDRMPYLHAVCSEVLRYLSPVPMTLREAAVDTTIQGRRVPKGTRIVIAPSGTNKDVALWGPDATRFNPDRWLPRPEGSGPGDGKAAGLGGATSNYALLTFLHGPRSCIGLGFARAEFACLLAAWVGRMEFELEDPALLDEGKMEIKGGVTSRPAKGLHVKARVLDGW